MSYIYKYDFVSPEPIFAEVKEDLRSYFNTGIVDDVMFPKWLEYCLKKIGKTSYPVVDTVLFQKDFESKLPEDFYKMREVHSCHPLNSIEMPIASATYIQKRILGSELCFNRCKGCVPDCVNVVEKTTGSVIYQYSVSHLLRPGNIKTREKCDSNCNINSEFDSFDIVDNRLITNIREATLYITYYKEQYDDNTYQLVPDFPEFGEFLRSYIRYKCFEVIFNNITDETFNQVQSKLIYYKQQYDEAFIIVKTELMKKTIYQQVRDVRRKTYDRFNDYEIR